MMLSYKLDEEHEDLRKSVQEFARDVVAPVIPGLYEKGEFPYDIVAQMGRMGLFGLPVPEERSRFVALSTRNEASAGG